MGVDRTDYLMYGVDVGADQFDWDKHEAECNGAPGARFDLVYEWWRCALVVVREQHEAEIGRGDRHAERIGNLSRQLVAVDCYRRRINFRAPFEPVISVAHCDDLPGNAVFAAHAVKAHIRSRRRIPCRHGRRKIIADLRIFL